MSKQDTTTPTPGTTFAERAVADEPATTTPADITSTYMRDRQLTTKHMLDLQPKHRVRLTAAKKGEPNYEVVGVNGYNFQIKRGVEVEVPETVYNLLVNAELI
jgi:hypothetical protein